MINKQNIIIAITVVITLVLSGIVTYKQNQKLEDISQSYNILDFKTWTVDKAKAMDGVEIFSELKYGRIVYGNNVNSNYTKYCYVPNIPFPTEITMDRSKIIATYNGTNFIQDIVFFLKTIQKV